MPAVWFLFFGRQGRLPYRKILIATALRPFDKLRAGKLRMGKAAHMNEIPPNPFMKGGNLLKPLQNLPPLLKGDSPC